jgi:hypothetical protein
VPAEWTRTSAGGSAVDVRDQRGTVLSLDKVEDQAVGGAAGPSDQRDGVADRARTSADDDDGATGDGERLSDRPADPLTTARHERELAYEHGHGRNRQFGQGNDEAPASFADVTHLVDDLVAQIPREDE